MELSVFEKITLPTSKDEKKRLSFFSSKPHLPKLMSCNSTEELIDIVTNRGWSPFVFDGYRAQKSFLRTNFLVLDIDDGLTISDALDRVKKLGLYCVCLPTASHTKELNKYRLIFVTDLVIDKVDTFKENMNTLVKDFPESDPSCVTDCARFYFGCKFSDDGFVYEGDLIKVIEPKKITNKKPSNTLVAVSDDIIDQVKGIYGKERSYLPECVSHFIKNASTGIDGNWIISLNAFVFTLSTQGFTYESIYSTVDMLAPDELDYKDEDCIDRAYKDGQDVREQDERTFYSGE